MKTGLCCLLLVAFPVFADVWYVDKANASGTADGRSWSTAFTTLAAAVEAARIYSGDEVWVRQGVYDEPRVSVLHDPPEDTGSLVMKAGVHLYGGFAGTELTRFERAAGLYSTIDGSKALGGGPAFHVVVGANDATLDGFEVTGGNASHMGYPRSQYLGRGGGMLNVACAPRVENCRFVGNRAYLGAGMYNEYNAVVVTHCVFEDNHTDGGGGAMRNEGAALTIEDCSFVGNTQYYGPGSSMRNVDSVVLLSRCAFVKNAGSVYCYHGSLDVRECLFSENTGGLTVTYCEARVSDCDFDRAANGWQTAQAVESAGCTVLQVDRCRFVGNGSDWGGPAICDYSSSKVEVANSLFEWNWTGQNGGAVAGVQNGVFTNCAFHHNTAVGKGGAISTGLDSSTRLESCTFAGNTAASGGAIHLDAASLVEIRNSILWDQTPDEFSAQGVSVVRATHSNIQGGYPGVGNIDADPLFMDLPMGLLNLQWGSPCIDTASPEGAPMTDRLGVQRPQLGGYDMGAYEFQLGDSDGDGMDDAWETAQGLDPGTPEDRDTDPDGDGVPNYQEFLMDTNPFDPLDPPSDLYVGPEGNDVTGTGRSDSPWATIGRAMSNAGLYSEYKAITVHVAAGDYDEPVAFAPNVTLLGAGAATTKVHYFNIADDEHVVVEGAEGARLQDCAIAMPGFYTTSTVLLRVDNVSMDLANVVFDGNDNLYSLGALVSGTGSSDSTFEGCTFRRLHFGVQAVNTAANITQNTFEGIRGDAVFVRLPDARKDGDPLYTPILGDALRPSATGNNAFRNVLGTFVLNMSSVETKAENNDWGLYAEAAIRARMSGPVDFVPFIGAEGEGEGEAQFVLTVTVWPQDSGTVFLEPSGGVYDAGTVVVLGAASSDGWTFDHWEGNVADTTAAMTMMAMNRDETVRAVFVADGNGGCCAGGSLGTTAPMPPSASTGSMLIVAALMAVLLVERARSRSGGVPRRD